MLAPARPALAAALEGREPAQHTIVSAWSLCNETADAKAAWRLDGGVFGIKIILTKCLSVLRFCVHAYVHGV